MHGNKQYNKNVNDGALFHHPNSKKPETSDSAEQVVVFEPEQIHILGTKQDIEGFKEFVSKNINERFAEQAPTQFDRDRLKAINELNDMVRNFRVDEILAEKGYDVQDFISNLETANNQDELNKIINKILQLLC